MKNKRTASRLLYGLYRWQAGRCVLLFVRIGIAKVDWRRGDGKVNECSVRVIFKSVNVSLCKAYNVTGTKALSRIVREEQETAALKGIDALKVLPAARRAEIANEIWRGYNKRLHQQGFELFTKIREHFAALAAWSGCILRVGVL